MSDSLIPILTTADDRLVSIFDNTAAIFNIANNPSANGSKPLHAVRTEGMIPVYRYSSFIEQQAAMAGVDPNLVKAIMYVENAQGWYDGLLPRPSSLLPMNIQPSKWDSLGGIVGLDDPYQNIKAGIELIKRIESRLLPEDRTIENIATLYHGLGLESVDDYGARVNDVYERQIWAHPGLEGAVTPVESLMFLTAIGIDAFSLLYQIPEIGHWIGQNLPIPFNIDQLITNLQTLFHAAKTQSSPIILDLDGDGVETLSTSAGIHFDHDGNGFAETSGWAGKDDGLLVWDKNGNGRIDSGAELFGNNTVLGNGSKAANGFTALVDLDNNHDGKLDAQDSAFGNLRVWQDSNSDGQVQDGELLTLIAAGVQSLNTRYSTSTVVDVNGNQHKQVGNFTRTVDQHEAVNDRVFGIRKMA